MKQLRNKAFLVIDVIKNAAQGVKTEKKGWANQADNWHVEMVPHMERKINDKTLLRASIIIDVTDKKLIRNAWSGITEDEHIVEYYLKEYSNIVQLYLQQNPDLMPVQSRINLSL
jgi:hypothetical protein